MICLENGIPGSVRLRRVDEVTWHVTQRALPGEQDNNHNPAWLRVRNTGSATTVRLRLRWAEFRWMGYRRFGCLLRGTRWEAIRGVTTPRETHYEFTAPAGDSWFGSVPWYDNDAAARFLRAMLRRGRQLCRAHSIGTTAEGRDIPCLTVTDPSSAGRKRNVVLLTRVHANESSGSFAFEEIGRWLTGPEASRELLRRCCFHLVPVANPDGVAHGIKLTHTGPAERFDMERGSMTSDDPSIAAVRQAVLGWKPSVLLDYHTYLFSPPFLYTFDRALALRMLSELLAAQPPDSAANWLTHIPAPTPGSDGLRGHCRRAFGTQVLVTELPWYGGRLPSEIAAQGLRFFQAALRATGLTAR